MQCFCTPTSRMRICSTSCCKLTFCMRICSTSCCTDSLCMSTLFASYCTTTFCVRPPSASRSTITFGMRTLSTRSCIASFGSRPKSNSCVSFSTNINRSIPILRLQSISVVCTVKFTLIFCTHKSISVGCRCCRSIT